MASQMNLTRLKNRTRLHGLVAILLAGFILSIGASGYSTAEPESVPADAYPPSGRGPSLSHHPFAQSTTFAPFLNMIPSEDGTELFISAGGVGELGGTVFANIDLGPGHDKGGWTMTYSDTVRSYVTSATGFTPNTSMSGAINITTTLGLDSGVVDFNRAYVPASMSQALSSIDGNLQLSLVMSDTIPFTTYIAIVPSYAPPGPAPVGHRLAGSTYSVRAAGALLTSDKPMSLRLYYDDTTLAGADPHTLAIFAWDAFHKRWDKLGGRLFYQQHYLSVPTSRFTTFALMATPTWRDEFNDLQGLTEHNDVTLGPHGDGLALVLSGTAISGTAISEPITPTTGFAAWDSLIFTGMDNPPTTTLKVDVLGPDGGEVLSAVTSGASLTDLDPDQYPSLKLRASLSSTVTGETPVLDEWQLSWQFEEHKVYLPLVLK